MAKLAHLTLYLSLLSSACSAAHGRGGDDRANHDEASEPQDQPVQTPEPACRGALPAGAPVLIADDVEVDSAQLGPCGELAYQDKAHTLHLLDASFSRELHRAPLGGVQEFSDDGALFLGYGDGKKVLYDLHAEQAHSFDAQEAGFLWADESWSGTDTAKNVVFVSDDLGLGMLTQDGRIERPFEPRDVSFVEAWSPLGSRVLYMDEQARPHVADFSAREDVRLELEVSPLTGEFGARDLYRLSEDGKILLFATVFDKPCDDTICTEGDGQVTVVELAQKNRMQKVSGSGEFEIDALESAPYLVLEGTSGMSLVESGPSGAIASYPEHHPLALLPEHGEVLSRHGDRGGLSLVSFGEKGKITEVSANSELSLSNQPELAFSRDESHLAYGRGPERCVHYPDMPEVCHAQIWELDLWQRGRGVVHTFLSTQPLELEWLGNDGTILLSGDLVLGGVPDRAPAPFSGESGLYLFSPEGKVIAKLPFLVDQLMELDDSLLLVTGEGRTTRVQRLSTKTGALTMISEHTTSEVDDPYENGPTIELMVDREHKRLAYQSYYWSEMEQSVHAELYAGSLL
jgi:hypothetical protein